MRLFFTKSASEEIAMHSYDIYQQHAQVRWELSNIPWDQRDQPHLRVEPHPRLFLLLEESDGARPEGHLPPLEPGRGAPCRRFPLLPRATVEALPARAG